MSQPEAPQSSSDNLNMPLARLSWIHWCVVILSLILTLGAWFISDNQVEKNKQQRFEREVDQVIQLVKERMELYENVLQASAAYVDANQGFVTHEQWYNFSHSLDIDKRFPGVNGIGVIFNIAPEKLDSFIAQQRLQRKDFSVHPSHSRNDLWPITYIEPVDVNKKAVGLDIAFEDNRYNAAALARDTGLSQVTGPITLVQDEKQTPGFLFYVPFYQNGDSPNNITERRAKIAGATYAPFIMYKLMEGTLDKKNRLVNVRISDGETLLFSDTTNTKDESIGKEKINADFITTKDITMHGRVWSFVITSNNTFSEAARNSQPLLILIGGLTIDSLLFILFVFLANANRKAIKLADSMTKDLKEKAKSLKEVNYDLEQFAYVASHDLKSPLNAIKKIIAWIEEDCKGILPLQSQEHIALLKGRTKRMNKLLDDLLHYSRIGRINYPSEAFELSQSVTNIFNYLDHSDSVKLTADTQELYLPRIPFEIIARNMISNSIKHHDKDTADIGVICKESENSYHFTFTDDGPGIPPRLHEKAMEMFQTLQARDQVEGSGMGLAISKKIIEHYKGSIEIEPHEGRGIRIHLNWPKSNPGNF
ncbi:CHASE domain-containing protein [Aliikangiella sp. IMCC44653]